MEKKPTKRTKEKVQKEKSKMLGIRLPNDFYERLRRIGTRLNLSPGQLGKVAIMDWMEIYYNLKGHGMVMLPEKIIIQLIENIDAESLQTILIEDMIEKFVEIYEFLAEKSMEEESLENFITFNPKLLGVDGLMWFNFVEYNIKDGTLIFKGTHNLGEKWALFYKNYSKKLMDRYFKYQLMEDTLTISGDSIYLEFHK